MSSSLLHQTNKKLILSLIKRKGEISRSEIARITKLTPPTISKIIAELIHSHKLIEYKGIGNSNGGRPPVIVKFKNDNNYIIGIDVGATYIRGCLVDLNANFISEIQISTEIDKGFNHIIEKIVHIINRFQSRPDKGGKIWGVGVGVAGQVDSRTGIIMFSPDFGWENINFHEEIERRIDLPVFYDNSTRLMALGELNFGKHPKQKDFALINVGYGIAASMVIDGNLVKGCAGFAGELGHIPIDTCGNVKCKCGRNGCLEALASGHRITSLGIKALKNKDAKILFDLAEGNPAQISAKLVAKAAIQGDLCSKQIYEEVTNYLAMGIGVLANLLNPEIVYIGGGVSLNGKFFFDSINSKVTNYLLRSNYDLKILPSTFGEQATSIGAVSLVLEKVLNLEL
jgi:glucokinase-like ROK family protein